MNKNVPVALLALKEALADMAIEVEAGNQDVLELVAYLKEAEATVAEFLSEEVKRAAYDEALKYGKDGRAFANGLRILPMESASYKYDYPSSIKAVLDEASALKKQYEEAAKIALKNGGRTEAVIATPDGEAVAVLPAKAVYTYTVKVGKA